VRTVSCGVAVWIAATAALACDEVESRPAPAPNAGPDAFGGADTCVGDEIDPAFDGVRFGFFGVNVPSAPPTMDFHDGSHWFVGAGAVTQLRAGWVRVGYEEPAATNARISEPYLHAFEELLRRYHAAGIRVLVLVTEGIAGPIPMYSSQLCVSTMTDLWPRCTCSPSCSNVGGWGIEPDTGMVIAGGFVSRWSEHFAQLTTKMGRRADGGVDANLRPDAWELLNEPDDAAHTIHPSVAGVMLASAQRALAQSAEPIVFGALVNPGNGAWIEASARLAIRNGAGDPPYAADSIHDYTRVRDASDVGLAVATAWSGRSGSGRFVSWTRGRPIWITEFGYRSSPCPDAPYGCDPSHPEDDTTASQAEQATAIRRFMASAKCTAETSRRVERAFVFAWSDWSQGFGQRFGVVDAKHSDCPLGRDNRSYGHKKPSFSQFASVATRAAFGSSNCGPVEDIRMSSD